MPPHKPFGPQDPFSLANNMRRVNEYGHWRSQKEAREQEILQQRGFGPVASPRFQGRENAKTQKSRQNIYLRLREELAELDQPQRGEKASGQRSRLALTSLLAVELDDHGTALLAIIILAGPLRGRQLSDLTDDELRAFHTQCTTAADRSRAVFESWLDRNRVGWRQRWETPRSHSRPQPSVAMNKDEAFAILGLKNGATADAIRAAHKRLMKGVHPDLGGSDYLAAKINQAKDVLLHD